MSSTTSGATALIANKMAQTKETGKKEDKIRFVVTMNPKDRKVLEGLAKELGEGQITLASELLSVALADALAVVTAAKAPKA